jgi:hypothetical protein
MEQNRNKRKISNRRSRQRKRMTGARDVTKVACGPIVVHWSQRSVGSVQTERSGENRLVTTTFVGRGFQEKNQENGRDFDETKKTARFWGNQENKKGGGGGGVLRQN